MNRNELSKKDKKYFDNLTNEAHARLSHIRTGSHQTKARYKSAIDQFNMYLAKDYKKRSLNNIEYRHFQGFVDHMKAEGKSNATITTTMSGLRYYFDQVTNGRIYVPKNSNLGVASRTRKERINVNRAMPLMQFNELIDIAKENKEKDIELQLKLGYYLGLRVHEILGMKRYDLKNASKACTLFSNKGIGTQPYIKVKGKSGLVRNVYIETEDQFELIEEVLAFSTKGDTRVFNDDDKMHKKIKRLQKFISKHRNEKFGSYKVTPHSLRHSYAQNMNQRLIDSNIPEMERKYRITKNLGHNRFEVVDIYLENIDDWNQ